MLRFLTRNGKADNRIHMTIATCRPQEASPLNGIADIVSLRARRHVRRTNAAAHAVIAVMANLCAIGDRADFDRVGKSVRIDSLTMQAKDGIAVTVVPACPNPATA